ncbi:hypothetical protein EIP86_004327 [Pleurotus ostreatoroseus]|nr:hypothetical protein EIP86_004327 [Pleurotus ostreatoroseus]
MVEHDLSLAFRGMAVEDEFGAGQPYRQGGLASQTSAATGQAHASPPQPMRGPHPMQQPRGPFPGYPQAEYAPYYTGPSRVDYPYPYEGYRPNDNMYASSPALSTATPAPNVYPGMAPHPHAVPDIHNQQFYDYSGSTRPPSQFFYPSQPLMYAPPHSPMTGQTKKRGMQYNPPQPQQLPPQTLIYPNLLYMHSGMSTAIHAQHHGGRRRQEDSNAAFRSQLLEEFRNDKVRKWELKDIFGYVVEFSSDQHGSRFIQQKLESATEEEKQIVFDEIVPQQALHLIQDVFGNYVIQKLFEYGTPIQKTLLTNVMEGHILPLSLQMYGCRVVQKAIENVTPEQQSVFVKELNDSVLRCVKDANGNHVIQRLIERVPPERLDFVKSFRGNVYDLSTHPYGCRVLQRCFEHLPEEHTRPLLDELHKYAIHLMQDQFGSMVNRKIEH